MVAPVFQPSFKTNESVRGQEWITVDVLVKCGLMREDGMCRGEVKFPTLNFGRRNTYTKKHYLWKSPLAYGQNGPGSFNSICRDCGVQMYITRILIIEAKKRVVESLCQEGYQEVDEKEVFL